MNTILWLHGFPLTSAIFAKQLSITGVEHVMPDLPPLGSMDDYARFAVEQLDARGIAKATFAGLSMGGYVCFAAMRLFPERVSGLILIDTRETADTDEGRKGRYAMIEKAEREGVAPIAESMLPKMLTAGAPPELREYVREVMMSVSREFVVESLRAMAARPDSSALLPGIAVPALVVVGEEDPITPPADAERMAAAIPNAKLVKLAGAAHLSNVEKAEAFNEEVTEWTAGGTPAVPSRKVNSARFGPRAQDRPALFRSRARVDRRRHPSRARQPRRRRHLVPVDDRRRCRGE